MHALCFRCPYSEGAMRRAVYERVASCEGGEVANATYKPHLPLLAQSSLQFSDSCSAVEARREGNGSVVPSASCQFVFSVATFHLLINIYFFFLVGGVFLCIYVFKVLLRKI